MRFHENEEVRCIDTFSHHSILGKNSERLFDARFTPLQRMLGDPVVKGVYAKFMSVFNLRDNQGAPEGTNSFAKNLVRIAFTANLPFASQMNCEDLLVSMRNNHVSHSMLVNLEPFSTFEESLKAIDRYPRQFFAIAHFAPTDDLDAFAKQANSAFDHGAKGIYVHPILDERDPSCELYHRIAEVCAAHDLPMICRTGLTHYSERHDAELALAPKYESLIKAHPKTSFVLSHSNLAQYRDAIAMAKTSENIWLDTAWQNVQSISEMIQEIGAERILFASDWPILGDQQAVQRRILEKLNLDAQQLEAITFMNANRLYRLDLFK